jgi:mono/diheme cytochrome c family protein
MRVPRVAPRLIPLFVVPVVLLGCAGDAPDLPGDQVEAASVLPASLPDPALFDSIAWPDARLGMDRGATVYAYSCAKCHGDTGAGDGHYQLQGRMLQPPSFLTPDWRFAHDMAGLREAVFAGNDRGMPHWGDAGLSPRDMDAVARYILYGLRRDRF